MNWEEQEKRIEESVRLQDEQLRAYLAMTKTFECEVCSAHGQKVVSLGGRGVVLCKTHLNAWQEVFHAHVLRDQYNDSQVRLYVAIYRGDEEAAMERNRVWQDVTDAIYELSGEWLKEEKTKWQER